MSVLHFDNRERPVPWFRCEVAQHGLDEDAELHCDLTRTKLRGNFSD